MFQDNVCHDLAVNKATQPSKYYGAGHAAKVGVRLENGNYPTLSLFFVHITIH